MRSLAWPDLALPATMLPTAGWCAKAPWLGASLVPAARVDSTACTPSTPSVNGLDPRFAHPTREQAGIRGQPAPSGQIEDQGLRERLRSAGYHPAGVWCAGSTWVVE